MQNNINHFLNGVFSAAAADINTATNTADDLLHRLREEKQRLQEYLDRIFGISSAIIYILDANGHFIFVNRAVEGLLNFSPEEIIGKHFSFILPPEEYERVSREMVLPRLAGNKTGDDGAPKLFNERRTGARRTRNMEVRLMTRRDDNYKLMVGDVTGIVDVEGAYTLSGERERVLVDERERILTGDLASGAGKCVFIGSQGVIFDVTRYKLAENERLDIHKKLFQIQKIDAVAKLAGRVAHDLNNSLGSIIGAGEMLRQEIRSYCSPTAASYIENLLTAARHAAELAGKLSELRHRGDSEFKRLSVHAVIENVLNLVKAAAADSGISVCKNLFAVSDLVIASETMLQNAVLNIALNAVEAMKRGGGTLTVETSDVDPSGGGEGVPKNLYERGEYIKISVRDTGAGMSEEVNGRLFEPFFTTDTEKGLGLGLVSVRECLRTHGGIVDVHSELGKGSAFDMYLPTADNQSGE